MRIALSFATSLSFDLISGGSGKQDSLKKAKSVNLKVSNASKTPRKKIEAKKKLWSEIAKKTPAKKPVALTKATQAQRAIKRIRKNVKVKTPGKTVSWPR